MGTVGMKRGGGGVLVVGSRDNGKVTRLLRNGFLCQPC